MLQFVFKFVGWWEWPIEKGLLRREREGWLKMRREGVSLGGRRRDSSFWG